MGKYFEDLNLQYDWILEDQSYLDRLYVDPEKWNHYYLPPEHLTKEFKDWVDSLGLIIRYSEIFYTKARGSLFIHSDHLDPIDSCKINWVYDQGPTAMRWFRVKEGKELKLQENTIGGFYYACDNDDDYILDEEHRVGKGTLLNVGTPHDVINNTDYPRWCVSIVLQKKESEKRLGYLELKEILKDYIKST
jgi:hypothetical protein